MDVAQLVQLVASSRVRDARAALDALGVDARRALLASAIDDDDESSGASTSASASGDASVAKALGSAGGAEAADQRTGDTLLHVGRSD